jgi:hypothetical protein
VGLPGRFPNKNLLKKYGGVADRKKGTVVFSKKGTRMVLQ